MKKRKNLGFLIFIFLIVILSNNIFISSQMILPGHDSNKPFWQPQAHDLNPNDNSVNACPVFMSCWDVAPFQCGRDHCNFKDEFGNIKPHILCGTCPEGTVCDYLHTPHTCVTCTPNCQGKSCGLDGCGGTCGTCTTGQTCNSLDQCEIDKQKPCPDNCNGRCCYVGKNKLPLCIPPIPPSNSLIKILTAISDNFLGENIGIDCSLPDLCNNNNGDEFCGPCYVCLAVPPEIIPETKEDFEKQTGIKLELIDINEDKQKEIITKLKNCIDKIPVDIKNTKTLEIKGGEAAKNDEDFQGGARGYVKGKDKIILKFNEITIPDCCVIRHEIAHLYESSEVLEKWSPLSVLPATDKESFNIPYDYIFKKVDKTTSYGDWWFWKDYPSYQGPLYGFSSAYGLWSLNEDIAMFVETVFCYPETFKDVMNPKNKDSKDLLKKYLPAYKQKLDILYKYKFISKDEYNKVLSYSGILPEPGSKGLFALPPENDLVPIPPDWRTKPGPVSDKTVCVKKDNCKTECVCPQTNEKSCEDEIKKNCGELSVVLKKCENEGDKVPNRVAYLKVSEKGNFNVMSNQGDKITCEYAETLEYLRCKIAVEFFGKPLPDTLPSFIQSAGNSIKITIKENPNRIETLCETTSMTLMNNPNLKGKKMLWMKCEGSSKEKIMKFLEHEMYHIISIIGFRNNIPQWLEEGIGQSLESQNNILEPDKSRCEYFKKLLNYDTENKLPFMRDIFGFNKLNLNIFRDNNPYYVKANNLAEFLIKEGGNGCKGKRKLSEFIKEGMDEWIQDGKLVKSGNSEEDWLRALKNNYGFNSFDELEKAWRNNFDKQLGPGNTFIEKIKSGCNPCTCKE